MKFTPFRKSYGDFEVVIPAVDFSDLTSDAAHRVYTALENFKADWVCLYLKHICDLECGAYCIAHAFMLANHSNGVSLEELIYTQHPTNEISFDPRDSAGQVLRQEWCKHMAAEIKREFGLKG